MRQLKKKRFQEAIFMMLKVNLTGRKVCTKTAVLSNWHLVIHKVISVFEKKENYESIKPGKTKRHSYLDYIIYFKMNTPTTLNKTHTTNNERFRYELLTLLLKKKINK